MLICLLSGEKLLPNEWDHASLSLTPRFETVLTPIAVRYAICPKPYLTHIIINKIFFRNSSFTPCYPIGSTMWTLIRPSLRQASCRDPPVLVIVMGSSHGDKYLVYMLLCRYDPFHDLSPINRQEFIRQVPQTAPQTKCGFLCYLRPSSTCLCDVILSVTSQSPLFRWMPKGSFVTSHINHNQTFPGQITVYLHFVLWGTISV